MQSTTNPGGVLTADTYPAIQGQGASLGPSPIATQLNLEVWNAGAIVQLLIDPGTAPGWGNYEYGDEFTMSSQAQTWQNVFGFHARSAVAGQPATIRAQLYQTTDQSAIGTTQPLQGLLLPNGIVAPKIPIFTQSGIALTSSTKTLVNQILIGSWQYVLLMGTTTANTQIDLFWASLDALSGANGGLGTEFVDNRFLAAGNPFTFLAPVMGDVLTVQANALTTATMTLYVTGTNTAYRRTPYSLEQILNSSAITALAQNTTQEVTFLPFTGLATLYIQANSASPNYNIRTKCYDLNGTTLLGRTLLGNVPAASPTGDFESDVWLPPTINTVAVTNLSATALSATVTAFAKAWGGP